MDVGIIDINTCEPVPNVLVDLWHANTLVTCPLRGETLELMYFSWLAFSTGHYAGHADPDPELIWEGPAPNGIRKGLLYAGLSYSRSGEFLTISTVPSSPDGTTTKLGCALLGRQTRMVFLLSLVSTNFNSNSDFIS